MNNCICFFLVIVIVDVVCCRRVGIVVVWFLVHRTETHETSIPQSSAPHTTHSVKLMVLIHLKRSDLRVYDVHFTECMCDVDDCGMDVEVWCQNNLQFSTY